MFAGDKGQFMTEYTAAREKTQEKIKAAFTALLQEKDYTDITVREIASRADIGFKTLYRHYSDKKAIADELYREIWEQILARISDIGLAADPEAIVHHLLVSIQGNAPLMRAFIALGQYQDILPAFVREFGLTQVRVYRPDLFECDSAYASNLQSLAATYFMTGQIELVRWWLLQDDMTVPTEAMVSMVVQLVIQPIMSLKLPELSGNAPETQD